MARVLEIFEPPDGGVAQAVLQLAGGLSAHGHEVEVAGPPGAAVEDGLRAAGIRVHDLGVERSYADPRREAGAVRRLTRLIRGGGFDLVHCHAAKAGVLGRLAARAAGVPAVYSPHCLPFVGEVGAARRAFGIGAERLMGPLTAALLCVCEDERALALRHRLVPRERTHVVHNGTAADRDDVEPDPRLEALRGASGVLAGAVTALRDQKGLPDLLAATPAILAADPRARVAIVGNGPVEDALRERARALGLDREERFAMLPFEGPPARHIRALDVYVLPSLWEAFPIGTLEAMACGVPQVATDVGGTREGVKPETGLLVPAHDPQRLAAATTALLGDDERRAELADASVRRHREHFTLEAMVAGTAAVYDAALSGAASTAGGRRATS